MRSWVIWSKLISLVALAGILYWRDLGALAESMSSIEHAGFTVVVASFIIFSIYQKRNLLRTLVNSSETKDTHGAYLLIIALSLYVFGSHTASPLWLHHVSLLVFVAGYLSLRVDHRIPKMMLTTFIFSLFLLPLPIEVRIVDNLNISSLVAFLLIAPLLAQSFDFPNHWKAVVASVGVALFIALSGTGVDLASTFSPLIGAYFIVLLCAAFRNMFGGKGVEVLEPCPLCESEKKEEVFCRHCGKRLTLPEPKPEVHSYLRLLALSLVVVVLSFAAIPTLSLENGDFAIKSLGAWGTERQPAFSTPQGWVLNSSRRVTSLEIEYEEELVLKNVYVGAERPEEEAYTLYLEISTKEPYTAATWLYLPGWNKTQPQDSTIPFGGAPPARYVVLQKEDKTIVVLSWTASPLLLSGSTFLEKRVGASLAMNLTGTLGKTAISEISQKMGAMFEPTAVLWSLADIWADHARRARHVYDQLAPLLFSAVGLGGTVALVLKAKQWDGETEKRVDSAMVLPREDKMLLSAVLEARKRNIRLSGRNIFGLYKEKIHSDIGVDRFHEKLNRLVDEGVVQKELVTRDSEVTLIWRLSF